MSAPNPAPEHAQNAQNPTCANPAQVAEAASEPIESPVVFWETKRQISHVEARESCRRLINSHFRKDDRARASIPANPDRDDDLIMMSYIRQQARAAVPVMNFDPSPEALRSLEAAIAAGPGMIMQYKPETARVVKQLEWSDPHKVTNGCWTANSILGTFSVAFDDGWHACLEDGTLWEWEPEQDPRGYDGPFAAQQACQLHLDQRVHSVLIDQPATSVSFQARVQPWMHACFGPQISADIIERNHRFLEEALELVQALGCTASEAHQLVDYVFHRRVGEPKQEVGGVMVTLAALCLAGGLDMHDAGETELARVWTKVDAIRAKQADKPKHSPLPQHVEAAPPSADMRELIITARIVAYEDQSHEAIQCLDRAVEKFATAVPWDNEPDAASDTATISAAEPAYWAVHSRTGIHIGLWPQKADAEEALREYGGGTITPLYASPQPALPATEPPTQAELAKALADLTDAFLSRNGGSFPLDETNDNERHWKRAMSRAYALIGPPNTAARTERYSGTRAPS